MVFFNLIYQGYTQDHQRILKLGLGAYLGVVALLFSGKLPENVLQSKAVEFFKSYGWLLVLIDYLVLNLLHYFQTGQYLFRQTPQTPYRRPHYVAWQSPQNYLENEDLEYEDQDYEDDDPDHDPDHNPDHNPDHAQDRNSDHAQDHNPDHKQKHETDNIKVAPNAKAASNARHIQPLSQVKPSTTQVPFIPRPELLIPTGLQTGGAQSGFDRTVEKAPTNATANATANASFGQAFEKASLGQAFEKASLGQAFEKASLGQASLGQASLGQASLGQVSSGIPFDPNYTIDDDQNASVGDDQDYFDDNQEPQIIDNYAMRQSNHQDDDSESISE